MSCHRIRYCLHLLFPCLVAATTGVVLLPPVSAQDFVSTSISPTAGVQPTYLPPGSPPPSVYRLGIGAQNTETGLRITEILPNSLAQRSGLETGDVIVTVSGQQIGYLSGKLIDLTNELARSVDSQGRVTLLVHDQRSRQLVNVVVQFPSSVQTDRALFGRVGAQNPYLPSPTTVLSVRLLDVTYPQWNDVVVAEQTIPSPQRLPIGYRLQVSPRNVKPDHRYAVQARMTDQGYVLLQTPAPIPVALTDQGTRLDLVLQATGVRPPNEVTPYEQLTKVFVDLLGRQPTAREYATWQQHLDRGGSIADVRVAILSSSEYFDRYYNDPQQYVAGVYYAIFGVSPTPQQRQALAQRLLQQGGIRHQLVEELAAQAGP